MNGAPTTADRAATWYAGKRGRRTPLHRRSPVIGPRALEPRGLGTMHHVLVQLAQAELRLVQVQDRDSPEVGVFGRLERDSSQDPTNRLLGVRVRIPFATDARNEPRTTRAQAEYTRAIAEYQAAERQLRGTLDRLRPGIAAARQQLALAERRYEALNRQTALVERSYRVGETSFAELLRARLALYDADLARARGSVAVQKVQSQINQALAVEP